MILKKIIPKFITLSVKVNLRKWNDFKNGVSKNFAKSKSELDLPYNYSLTQEIKMSEYFDNKCFNINLGIEKLNHLQLLPGEIFSFWNLVSRPSQQNHFKESRNIINGKLTADFGGGLCQLSSIIYHQALRLGFEIMERHNHSVDLYQENERFTPLGSDATVVYGYKDLRFKNNFNHPIVLRFSCIGNKLTSSFSTNEALTEYTLDFNRRTLENQIEVNTLIADTGELLTKSLYLLKI